jgi:uncharacterized protein HemY
MNDEISERLRRLKEIISKQSSDKALAYIDVELSSVVDPQYKCELLLAKALCISGTQNRRDVVELLISATEAFPSHVGPHYFLGENFLEESNFVLAAEHFKRAIEMTRTTGKEWFAESAMMLAAYCFARLGEKTKAMELLDSLADDVSVFWLDAMPKIDKAAVRAIL